MVPRVDRSHVGDGAGGSWVLESIEHIGAIGAGVGRVPNPLASPSAMGLGPRVEQTSTPLTSLLAMVWAQWQAQH